MPKSTSTWIDLRIHLIIIIGLLLIIMHYNQYVAAIGFVLAGALFVYGRERCRSRDSVMDKYLNDVVKNVNELSNYAIEKLPLAIVVLDNDARIQWCNGEMSRWFGKSPEFGTSIENFWENFELEKIWGQDGEIVFNYGEKYYQIRHRAIFSEAAEEGLSVLYILDMTDYEKLKIKEHEGNPVFGYIQIDNYDEVFQGMTDAQRTSVLIEINRYMDEWGASIGAYIRRMTKDMYIAVMDRKALELAMKDNFDILDKVRAVHGANRFPVTLSLGAALGTDEKLAELEIKAKDGLDLALGRGGDQVAVNIEGKMQFFGGKSQAVEKHTRVKSRVVSHAIHEIMGSADLVVVMGHRNEDLDSLGAAMGVVKMAHFMGKEAKIVLSPSTESVQKAVEELYASDDYRDLFVTAENLDLSMALNPILFIVDTHIPKMTAAPEILDKIDRKIVIDHHRRSENFIENPLLVYTEPSSSSTCELVTELIMYFSDELELGRLDATILYAGIIVDTKYFSVQAGVRTFDAAAYLRRCGADPVKVRHLFRIDYESARIKAQAMADAEFFAAGGLMVTVCPPGVPNVQVIAAQLADTMLIIEEVNMSLVLFPQDENVVGVSARSNGDINVQVIMEHFGGGGHQTVAGTQIKDMGIAEVRRGLVEYSLNYIEEMDKDESNITARH